MTERSYYWGGTSVGDATLAPYTDDEYTDIYQALFERDRTAQGVLDAYLNQLLATGAVSPVAIDTGAALVDGKFYVNDASLNVSIPTPSGATRIDRIVLRKDFGLQTVRITRVAGAEGGGAPSITQVDGSTWDIPLWQVSVTTLGAITLTDERTRAFTRLANLSSAITPSQITSDQNNYSPTNVSMASMLRLDTDASRNMTGLRAGSAGEVKIIVNIGSNDLVLKNESASSTAANRFSISNDLTLSSKEAAVLWYDSTLTRWVCIGTYSVGGGAVDVQVFTGSGTWTKPAGVTAVHVILYGGGGGGGGGASRAAGTSRGGGAGGGGGARAEKIYRASDLAATVAVTIGAGGTGGAGAATNAAGAVGNPGAVSTFGAHLSAFGGGGGLGGQLGSNGSGGGGGGVGGVGQVGQSAAASLGGAPVVAAGNQGAGGGGAGGANGAAGVGAENGGASGGGTASGAAAPAGGSSLFGGAGGGVGGNNDGTTPQAASAGGNVNTMTAGGGGAANGGAGAAGNTTKGGQGGGGGNHGAPGGVGGTGGQPGGGGGGGGAGTNNNQAGNGGPGGAGQCWVISW